MDPVDETKKIAAVRFSRAMGRSLRLWRLIWSLREFVAHGSAAAETGIGQTAYQVGRELIARPDFGTAEQRQAAIEALPSQATAAAANTVDDARSAASAASIVFAHSLLDAAVDEYCAISALLCPSDWRGFVDDSSVTLREAESQNLADLLKRAVSLHLKKLSNKSVLNKIRVLQQICGGSGEVLSDYTFDADRIDWA